MFLSLRGVARHAAKQSHPLINLLFNRKVAKIFAKFTEVFIDFWPKIKRIKPISADFFCYINLLTATKH